MNLAASAFAGAGRGIAMADGEQQPRSIDDIMETVDRHFPAIISARQDVKKAEAEQLTAAGSFDPSVKSYAQRTPSGEYTNQNFEAALEQPTTLWGTRLITGYRFGDGKFGPYDEKLKTNDMGEIRAGLEIPLLRGGSTDERRTRIATTEQGYNAATQSLKSQKLEAMRQAVSRYYDWLAAAEKLRVTNDLLKLAMQRDEATKHRVRHGDAALIDQVDNERSVLQRRAALIAAQRHLSKAALELSIYWRDPAGTPIVVSSNNPVDQSLAPKLIESRFTMGEMQLQQRQADPQAHPEVRRFKALLAQNAAELTFAENQFLPKIDSEMLVSQDLGSGSPAKARFEYKAGIKIELPLRRRVQRGKLEGILANNAKLEAQLNLAIDRIKVNLSDYTQSISASRDRSLTILRELELSERVEQAERIRFKHGDSNLLMVNIREQTSADARHRAIDALADYYKAVWELRLLMQSMAD